MGMLLVDKPPGITSHDVVAVVRRALKVRKAGHAGTLDPFATGLLVLGIGRATRLLEYLVGLDKEYEATARLGVATDSQDPEGAVVAEDDRLEGDLARTAIRVVAGGDGRSGSGSRRRCTRRSRWGEFRRIAASAGEKASTFRRGR